MQDFDRVWDELRCSFGGRTPEAERDGNALSWLVRRGELEEVAGQVRKRPVRYRTMAQRLVRVLDEVALACGELRRFLEKLDRHWERLNLNP